MFQELEQRITRAFEAVLRRQFEVSLPVVLEQPKQPSFGELAVPVAFQLARQLKKAPKQIAEQIVAAVGTVEGVSSWEIAGNGYINVRFDRAIYTRVAVTGQRPVVPPDRGQTPSKVVVEHTNINPNKAAHIGHLRNAVLGDTFVRMLRRAGRTVEVQNYIDNTGVQVADVVVGFHHLEEMDLIAVRGLIDNPLVPFDYFCWDLYARISSYYKEHPEALAWRADTLHAIEAGTGEIAELAHVVGDAIVRAHVKTMYRLGIEYDVLPRESEILHLQFWANAFELLKKRKAIYFEENGKNKGCWVMPSSAFRAKSEPVAEGDAEDDNKVIVRSNGTVTYVGKDIAYQLWKFGLLGQDFYYRPWSEYPDGRLLWVTTDKPEQGLSPQFGRADWVYNVIDSRQSYLQDVVVAGLRALDFTEQAERSVHFSYEMVALSPRTCIEMGIALSDEDKRKPFVEVSGRKGLGVKADDLIDKLIATARAEVDDRHPEADEDERGEVAASIAIGALRYFMLKFTRNSVIAFDFHEALSFEGETGPYAQYSAVRCSNILRKFEARGQKLPDFQQLLTPEVLERYLQSDDLWQYVLAASKVDNSVARAIASGEPAQLAKYAFQLAQAFNNFYHSFHVLQEQDAERQAFLLWLAHYFREQLGETLAVLGISVPDYM